MITKYRIGRNYSQIVKVEIERETKKFIWLPSGHRCLKESSGYSYYDSIEAAKIAIIVDCNNKIRHHQAYVNYFQELKKDIEREVK